MNKKILHTIVAPVCLMTALVGCVKQEDMDLLQRRLAQQETEQQQLRAQLANSQPMQADTWSSVQSMQQELNSLRGQLDDLKFQLENYPSIEEMNAMRGQVARNEAALRRIDGQFALDLQLDAPQPTFVPMVTPSYDGMPAASGGTGVNTGMTSGVGTNNAPAFNSQSNTMPANPQATQNTGYTGDASTSTGTFIVGGAGQAANNTPAASNAPKVEQAKPTEQALYDAGIAAFHERHYESALKSFADFAKIYPKHELASNAWFWQGECSYQMGKYPDAALAYEQVISKFPKSGKAASAMMKQGLCFLKMGKKDAAFIRLKDVSKKFPNSPESQRAKQIIQENK